MLKPVWYTEKYNDNSVSILKKKQFKQSLS
jgi:hypothetical protein